MSATRKGEEVKVTVICGNTECEATHRVTVRLFAPARQAKVTGPWESCHPGEPAEWEVVDIPSVCRLCGETLDTDANVDAAIEAAESRVDA